MSIKEKIIGDFCAATSSCALASFTCACCACDLPVNDRVCNVHSAINLDLLKAPSSHWNDPDFLPPPTPFQYGPLKDILLEPRGVAIEGGVITLDMCNLCLRSLHKHLLPKHALANKLYFGTIPDELKDLTMVKESMIARARAKSWIVKLQE